VSECIGMTWATLKATMIAAGFSDASDDLKLHDAVDRMIAAKALKRCSRHPDHYIIPKRGRDMHRLLPPKL